MTGLPVVIEITGLPEGVERLNFSEEVTDKLRELVPMAPGLGDRQVVMRLQGTPRAPDEYWQLRVAIRGLEDLQERQRLLVAALVLDRLLVWSAHVLPITQVDFAVEGSEEWPWFLFVRSVSDDDLERMVRWLASATKLLLGACDGSDGAVDEVAALQMRLIFSRIEDQLKQARGVLTVRSPRPA